MSRYVSVTGEAHAMLRAHLSQGDLAIDATCGRGRDTAVMAELVGNEGHVYAVDISPRAIEATLRHLQAGSLWERVTLVQGDHGQLAAGLPSEIRGRVSLVLFNLGYLPGGDHSLEVTGTATTLRALDDAWVMLRSEGILVCVCYPGHPGGLEESEAVRGWFQLRSDSERPAGYFGVGQTRSPAPFLLWLGKPGSQINSPYTIRSVE